MIESCVDILFNDVRVDFKECQMDEDESQKRHKLQYFDFTIHDRPTAVPQTILNKLAHDE